MVGGGAHAGADRRGRDRGSHAGLLAAASGHEPTLVEQAPGLRRGGYLVDFWGAGFDVAERMGIVPELMTGGYRLRELREVDRDGRRIASSRAAPRHRRGRWPVRQHRPLRPGGGPLRGAGREVETSSATPSQALDDDGERVHVTFARGAPREFDLVVGADGLHSRVRRAGLRPGGASSSDHLGHRGGRLRRGRLPPARRTRRRDACRGGLAGAPPVAARRRHNVLLHLPL